MISSGRSSRPVSKQGARHWEHSELDGVPHPAVANLRNDVTYNLDCWIPRFSGMQFEAFEKLVEHSVQICVSPLPILHLHCVLFSESWKLHSAHVLLDYACTLSSEA